MEERKPELKGKDDICSYSYHPEVNLLDLTVQQAERANLFKEDVDSMNKVALLVESGANASASNNYCGQNYLHQVTQPFLIELFGDSGVYVKAKALVHPHCRSEISPIDCAHTSEAVDLLCSFGEVRDNSPFIKGTAAHATALNRIGFNSENGLNQLDENKELFCTRAYEKDDLAAFIALIGEGVDVNQRNGKSAGWTTLHRLFSEIKWGAFDDGGAAKDSFEIQLINILMKHGVAPLKDEMGRTPLMCLNFSDKEYTRQVIDLYIGFEAAYYNLDPKEYKENFTKLRKGGFRPISLFSDSLTPIKPVFDNFWASFETHQKFNPLESHNPIGDWNELRGGFE